MSTANVKNLFCAFVFILKKQFLLKKIMIQFDRVNLTLIGHFEFDDSTLDPEILPRVRSRIV